MKKSYVKWFCFLLIFFISACSGKGTKLTQTDMDEGFKQNPVSDILVIAIADNDKNRAAFENKFVQVLKSKGVDAVSSAAAIPMPPDLKLKKEDILNVVKKYNSDSVIVTHLKSIKDKNISTRDAVSRTSYYSYYGYAFGWANQPGYSSTKTTVFLETNLYDVKTEQLMWTGQSQSLKADSVNKVISDVINLVVEDLQKNNLIIQK